MCRGNAKYALSPQVAALNRLDEVISKVHKEVVVVMFSGLTQPSHQVVSVMSTMSNSTRLHLPEPSDVSPSERIPTLSIRANLTASVHARSLDLFLCFEEAFSSRILASS